MISELEELILLAVAAMQPDSYSYTIRKELKETGKRDLSLATVHTALYRLESKGLVKSSMGGQTDKRGGRSKRLYEITVTGREAITDVQSVRQAFWMRLQPGLQG